ncbi:MAG: protein-L-isoaspartate(D-aspartate) O-methyltransferase [Zetaproteobacteria bacterium CG2_30_46_52]|nr:MAG: protein-L-isoaspartate(D-aspartate) O-methyltransferase [Zetaproteobacteria bacterium CG2_30_46_52]
MDAAMLNSARRNMVEYQIRCCKVLEPQLIDMLINSPREKYVPTHVRSLAYMEGSVPLPCNQEMLTPLQEAQILQAIGLQGTERVLEIGTGAGYLTGLLALLSDEVVSCEIHDELATLAKKNLSDNGIVNAKVMTVNAMDEQALAAAKIGSGFDVIVLGAGLTSIPAHIQNLLAPNGQLIAFIGKDIVTLEHHRWINGIDRKMGITETRLLPMEGLAVNREFVF